MAALVFLAPAGGRPRRFGAGASGCTSCVAVLAALAAAGGRPRRFGTSAGIASLSSGCLSTSSCAIAVTLLAAASRCPRRVGAEAGGFSVTTAAPTLALKERLSIPSSCLQMNYLPLFRRWYWLFPCLLVILLSLGFRLGSVRRVVRNRPLGVREDVYYRLLTEPAFPLPFTTISFSPL